MAVVVPDEIEMIKSALCDLRTGAGCPLIITTGGTGFAERDVTPEATLAVVQKELPGFGEIMRSASFAQAPTSILSEPRRAYEAARSSSICLEIQKRSRKCLPPLLPAIREALRHLQE